MKYVFVESERYSWTHSSHLPINVANQITYESRLLRIDNSINHVWSLLCKVNLLSCYIEVFNIFGNSIISTIHLLTKQRMQFHFPAYTLARLFQNDIAKNSDAEEDQWYTRSAGSSANNVAHRRNSSRKNVGRKFGFPILRRQLRG